LNTIYHLFFRLIQVIIPQNQVSRKHDIYVCSVSDSHCVAAKGHTVALVATTVETNNPEAELEPGFEILGPILEKFVSVEDIKAPLDDGIESNLYVTSSYDASTHFESTCMDVLSIYERIVGEPFDFSKVNRTLDEDEQ
jgi:Rab GDP dissociation inhibitor